MARKSEIRAQARAGLDALLKVGQAADEQAAARHLQEALEHITQAAEGVSLRETAAGRGRTQERLQERDYSTTERIALAKKGHAIPVRNAAGDVIGGRYPITTPDDVENAAHDADRTGAGEEERRHIVKNAKRLGAMDRVPRTWRGKKARTQESAPLTLRESVAIGEASLLEASRSGAQEDERLGLLERLGLDRDELGS